MAISSPTEPRLSFSANLTVRAISAAHQELLAFIDQHDAASVDLAEDAQLDLSFIQMLEAARIYAGTAGKSIALSRPASGTLLDTLRRGGFLDGMSAEDAQFWLHQEGIQ